MQFTDRSDAGRKLGTLVKDFADQQPIVVAMARGGVPVGLEVARALDAPLDVAVVRKIGAPRQPEFAIGALAEDGVVMVDRSAQALARVSDERLSRLIEEQRTVLNHRAEIYRAECPRRDLKGRTVILVDDGLATGSTAIAAARYLGHCGAGEVILAVPVCSVESVDRPPDESIDKVVCMYAPQPFYGVGMAYLHFDQVTDDEVSALLREARNIGTGEPGSVHVGVPAGHQSTSQT